MPGPPFYSQLWDDLISGQCENWPWWIKYFTEFIFLKLIVQTEKDFMVLIFVKWIGNVDIFTHAEFTHCHQRMYENCQIWFLKKICISCWGQSTWKYRHECEKNFWWLPLNINRSLIYLQRHVWKFHIVAKKKKFCPSFCATAMWNFVDQFLMWPSDKAM